MELFALVGESTVYPSFHFQEVRDPLKLGLLKPLFFFCRCSCCDCSLFLCGYMGVSCAG
ncbi:hypothetical protein RchiOBHm_Chr4g0429681 [Rosa chinensis]|uniref:Uncharacterized protein n=1 Tax=Rosa chinensis TaxID=74649 RepID=A0A2P6R082_ROSCH|nr:hypothetical protein RchiOBHm_Chr4g0429681 [Rosa chinensis]